MLTDSLTNQSRTTLRVRERHWIFPVSQSDGPLYGTVFSQNWAMEPTTLDNPIVVDTARDKAIYLENIIQDYGLEFVQYILGHEVTNMLPETEASRKQRVQRKREAIEKKFRAFVETIPWTEIEKGMLVLGEIAVSAVTVGMVAFAQLFLLVLAYDPCLWMVVQDQKGNYYEIEVERWLA